MTAAAPTQTLYAPNPPQIDEPWFKIAIVLVVLCLAVGFGGGM